MRIETFEWDGKNAGHILRHNVTVDEVEEIFVGAPLCRKARGGKFLALGQTLDGRYLFVVLVMKENNSIRPITARDMTKTETKSFKKWAGR